MFRSARKGCTMYKDTAHTLSEHRENTARTSREHRQNTARTPPEHRQTPPEHRQNTASHRQPPNSRVRPSSEILDLRTREFGRVPIFLSARQLMNSDFAIVPEK